ncbi:hypothetical protein WMF38_38730 [Sorangium sp. So ce118]
MREEALHVVSAEAGTEIELSIPLPDAEGVSQGVCRGIPKPATCSELSRLRRERDLFAGLDTAMSVTSGVVGTATLASFFTDFSFLRADPTKAQLALTLTVAPTQVGLVAYGLW